jgi:hypothetical protein
MKKIFFLLFVLFFSIISLHAQIITTWAGRGNGTLQHPNGDSSYKSLAKFSVPGFGYFDKYGNYLMIDGVARVRKIDTNGIVTSIAGNDISGFSGIGGPAALSQISNSSKIITDSRNNIYFSIISNATGAGRVLKIDAQTGILSVFAGNGLAGNYGINGPAINARFNGINSICFDKYDNMYLLGDWLIRKIDTNGILTKIAGTGTKGYAQNGSKADTALLGNLSDICIDTSNNIYIVDGFYNVIRKIDSTGVITTIAGTLAGFMYNGDSLLAVNAMIQPALIALDKSRNLYFADRFNNLVRVVKPNGMLYTIAGTGALGYSGDGGPANLATFKVPNGIAIDKCGNLYVPDKSNLCVRKINLYPDCADTIGRYFTPTAVSSLKYNDVASQINIYPNPVQTDLFIDHNALSPFNYSIYAINSAIALQEGKVFGEKSKINVALLPKGVYIIKFTIDGTTVFHKFIKE